MKAKAVSYFVEIAFIGVGAVVTSFIEQLKWFGFVLIGIGVVGVIMSVLWDKFFSPAKLRVDELAYWYIERPEPEHHAWSHCHEYNFAGKIEIIPRVKGSIKAIYLLLKTGGEAIEVELSRPLAVPSDITPRKKINRDFAFQKRLEKKIKIPSSAYVIMEFRHGRDKRHKVRLRADADYRFKLGLDNG